MKTIYCDPEILKKALVFKAVNLPTLRIVPGYNYVEDNVDDYFEGSKAAQANKEMYMKFQDQKTLSPDQKKEAKANKKRNDDLNSSRVTIKTQKETINAKTNENKELVATVEELKAANQKLQDDVQALMDASTKADDTKEEEKEDTKKKKDFFKKKDK